MKPYRTNAVIVGSLFILATVSGVLAAAIQSPITEAPDYLTKMSANSGPITVAAFLQFIMAISCAGIGISLYPIMKKYREGQAVAVAGFRIIEAMIQVVTGVCAIGLLALSQEFVKAGAVDPASFQATGALIKAGNSWLCNGAMLLCWCIAALMYYSVFYQYRLVPRWISAWGLVSIVLMILSSVLTTLNVMPALEPLQTIVNLSIAVQEMAFAVWLIAKGYATPMTASQPASVQWVSG